MSRRRWIRIGISTGIYVVMLASRISNVWADGGPALPPPVASDPTMPDLPAGLSADAVIESEADKKPEAATVWGVQAQLWWQLLVDRVQSPTPGTPDTTLVSNAARFVGDLRHEWALGRGWRVSLSDRIDAAVDVAHDPRAPSNQGAWNSLRELWGGWQHPVGDGVVAWNAGRINIRNGVGSGYNPSDFFKVDAVRTSTSLDPTALRANRLGVVMLQWQYLYAGGALSTAVVPRLSHEDKPLALTDNDPWYALGLERTNAKAAALFKWAPQISEWLSADFLFYLRQTQSPRAGINVSALLGDAVTANAEWVAGQCHPLPPPGAVATDRTWCAWGASNVTWTTPIGLELTLEYQYASDALSAGDWRAWRSPDLSGAQLARLEAIGVERALAQEPLVQQGWFLRAGWRDPFNVRGLALSAFVEMNAFDASFLTQAAFDWQLKNDWVVGGNVINYVGGGDTEYGQIPRRAVGGIYLGRAL